MPPTDSNARFAWTRRRADGTNRRNAAARPAKGTGLSASWSEPAGLEASRGTGAGQAPASGEGLPAEQLHAAKG